MWHLSTITIGFEYNVYPYICISVKYMGAQSAVFYTWVFIIKKSIHYIIKFKLQGMLKIFSIFIGTLKIYSRIHQY